MYLNESIVVALNTGMLSELFTTALILVDMLISELSHSVKQRKPPIS